MVKYLYLKQRVNDCFAAFNEDFSVQASFGDQWFQDKGSEYVDTNFNQNEPEQQDRYDEVFSEEDSFEETPVRTPLTDKRCDVVQEFLSTEKDYLEHLEIVRDYFIQPLTNQGILATDELEIIFINWNDVLLCTNRLYKSLKIRRKMNMKKDINIGDILCENFSQMGAYIRFCSSQYTAAGLLQKLIEIKPGFDEFLRHCQTHPKIQGYPLSFYLLKPVKRIMDYPILIQKIVKNTEESHPDYYYLNKALKMSKELCEQVNEGTRLKENTERSSVAR